MRSHDRSNQRRVSLSLSQATQTSAMDATDQGAWFAMYITVYIYMYNLLYIYYILYIWSVPSNAPPRSKVIFGTRLFCAKYGLGQFSVQPQLVTHLTKSKHSALVLLSALGHWGPHSRIKWSTEVTFRPTKWPCMSCCCGSCRCRFAGLFYSTLRECNQYLYGDWHHAFVWKKIQTSPKSQDTSI